MIRIENLSKKYKEHKVLNQVSLYVAPGELFAYLGPNGAGKTTTIRILTGLTQLTEGNAYINNFHIEKESLEAKRQCGIVPQAINLDQELSVLENLDVHCRLFQIPRAKRNEKVHQVLAYVDMADRQDTLVKHLSGGMKRRIMIARALVHSPRVLFLDEPTVGLDPNIRRRIWGLIKKIQQDGTTIFLTTHHIEEAEFLAHRVAFLDTGSIVAIDTPQNLMLRLGKWAVDSLSENEMKTAYFDTREQARDFMSREKETTGFTMRRVNLEDAFLELTGKKVK